MSLGQYQTSDLLGHSFAYDKCVLLHNSILRASDTEWRDIVMGYKSDYSLEKDDITVYFPHNEGLWRMEVNTNVCCLTPSKISENSMFSSQLDLMIKYLSETVKTISKTTTLANTISFRAFVYTPTAFTMPNTPGFKTSKGTVTTTRIGGVLNGAQNEHTFRFKYTNGWTLDRVASPEPAPRTFGTTSQLGGNTFGNFSQTGGNTFNSRPSNGQTTFGQSFNSRPSNGQTTFGQSFNSQPQPSNGQPTFGQSFSSQPQPSNGQTQFGQSFNSQSGNGQTPFGGSFNFNTPTKPSQNPFNSGVGQLYG